MTADEFGQLCHDKIGESVVGLPTHWTTRIGSSTLVYQHPRFSKHETGLGSTYSLKVSTERYVSVIRHRLKTQDWRYSWVGRRPSKAEEAEIRLLL